MLSISTFHCLRPYVMERLGVQYEKEHDKELKSTMYYMPEHFGDDVYGAGEDALPLPPPFVTRPRLGSRVLVTNNFTKARGGLSSPFHWSTHFLIISTEAAVVSPL